MPDSGKTDVGDLSKYLDDLVFDDKFWDDVVEQMQKEHKQYVGMCRQMQIDPVSGRSTMSWEDRNRPFNC